MPRRLCSSATRLKPCTVRSSKPPQPLRPARLLLACSSPTGAQQARPRLHRTTIQHRLHQAQAACIPLAPFRPALLPHRRRSCHGLAPPRPRPFRSTCCPRASRRHRQQAQGHGSLRARRTWALHQAVAPRPLQVWPADLQVPVQALEHPWRPLAEHSQTGTIPTRLPLRPWATQRPHRPQANRSCPLQDTPSQLARLQACQLQLVPLRNGPLAAVPLRRLPHSMRVREMAKCFCLNVVGHCTPETWVLLERRSTILPQFMAPRWVRRHLCSGLRPWPTHQRKAVPCRQAMHAR